MRFGEDGGVPAASSPAMRLARLSVQALGSVALLAGVILAPCRADQADPRLDALFERLASEAPSVWQPAEEMIWEIWLESGDDEIDRLMARGIEDMGARRLRRAVATFSEVIERVPDFAEAWNKRATAHYLAGELRASVADIRRTLELEPRHFGAISGMGLILVRRRDPEGALQAFERVLEIHPNAPGARIHVDLLRGVLRQRAV